MGLWLWSGASQCHAWCTAGIRGFPFLKKIKNKKSTTPLFLAEQRPWLEGLGSELRRQGVGIRCRAGPCPFSASVIFFLPLSLLILSVVDFFFLSLLILSDSQRPFKTSAEPTLNLHWPSSTLEPLRGRRAPAHCGQALHPPKGPKAWASGILPQKWQGRISSSIRPL